MLGSEGKQADLTVELDDVAYDSSQGKFELQVTAANETRSYNFQILKLFVDGTFSGLKSVSLDPKQSEQAVFEFKLRGLEEGSQQVLISTQNKEEGVLLSDNIDFVAVKQGKTQQETQEREQKQERTEDQSSGGEESEQAEKVQEKTTETEEETEEAETENEPEELAEETEETAEETIEEEVEKEQAETESEEQDEEKESEEESEQEAVEKVEKKNKKETEEKEVNKQVEESAKQEEKAEAESESRSEAGQERKKSKEIDRKRKPSKSVKEKIEERKETSEETENEESRFGFLSGLFHRSKEETQEEEEQEKQPSQEKPEQQPGEEKEEEETDEEMSEQRAKRVEKIKKEQESIERRSTGVINLDGKMEGGLVKNTVNLVTGKTGTGKTAFCASFLFEGAKKSQPGIYLTTEERKEDLKSDIMAMFGWDMDTLEEQGKLKIISLKPMFPSKEIDDLNRLVRSYISDLLDKVEKNIKEIDADRVVVDSVSVIEMFISDEYLSRVALSSLLNNLRGLDVTALLTGTVPETSEGLSGGGIIEFLVDTVIKLEFMPVAEEHKRTLSIRKMRRTDHSVMVMPFDITPDGLKIIEIK